MRSLLAVFVCIVLVSCGVAEEAAVPDGAGLIQEKNCISCHTASGAASVGPTWFGLAGSTVELVDGTTVVADSAYLRSSILDPQADIVRGFTTVEMPTIDVTDEEVDRLVAFIESLGSTASAG